MRGSLDPKIILPIVVLILAAAVLVLFILSQPPKAPPKIAENVSAPENKSVAPPQPPPPGPEENRSEPEPQPEAKVINGTTGELLERGIARSDSRFDALGLAGPFETQTLRWALGRFNETPDSVPYKENDLRASPIRFNKRYIDGLRGLAFTDSVPSGEDGPHYLFGTMLFINSSAPLDGYAANGSEFVIQYDPHPELSQILEKCRILYSDEGATLLGIPLKILDFQCKVIYGASP